MNKSKIKLKILKFVFGIFEIPKSEVAMVFTNLESFKIRKFGKISQFLLICNQHIVLKIMMKTIILLNRFTAAQIWMGEG